MKNVINRMMEFADSNNPFLGIINLIKEMTGAEYCSLAIYNSADLQVKWHYIAEHENNSDSKTHIPIPEEILSESMEKKKAIFLENDKEYESGKALPSTFPLKQLMIVPTSGKYLSAVVVYGNSEKNEKINSKKQIESVSNLLESNEQVLSFLNKYDKALELSLKDDLTKAYNRRYLDRALRDEINRASRNESKLSFIFFDLNDFRAFNDSYGHYYGSRLLVYITHKIMENVRGIDKFVRYGGDEFCVILPDTPVDGAIVVAKRILDVLKKLDFPTPDGKKVVLSACFGISSYPENAKNVKDLICEADRAMYSAKENGIDILVITREISERMQKRNVDV